MYVGKNLLSNIRFPKRSARNVDFKVLKCMSLSLFDLYIANMHAVTCLFCAEDVKHLSERRQMTSQCSGPWGSSAIGS